MKNFLPNLFIMYSMNGQTCWVGSGPNMKMFWLHTPG